MSNTVTPLAAVVLPPREGFGPNRSGAIGLLVRRLAAAPGFRTLVIGGPQDGPGYPDVAFLAVKPTRWRFGSTNIRYAISIAATLRRLKPALVEVHNRPEIALALAARLPHMPIALVLHNDPHGMRGADTPGERDLLLRKLALVMTCSNWLHDRLLEGLAAPARAPIVLHNCLDLREMPPPQPKEHTILFAGRVVADKGPDAFVAACAEALPHLPGWRAVMIGADRFRPDSPDTAYVERIRSAAAAAGVEMLGYRDHPAVLEAMTRAAIVVVPSRWPEPFGLVALEAMAAGAVLVSSPNGGLPEVGGDVAIYANPEHPSEIAAALRALASDAPRRHALGEAGRARARQFDMPAIAAQLAALRRGVMAPSNLA